MYDWCWYHNSRTDTVRKWRDDHAVAIWPLHGELTFDWQIQPSIWYFVRSAWFCLEAALQLSSSLGNHMNVAANVDMSWRSWSASLQPWQPYESEHFFQNCDRTTVIWQLQLWCEIYSNLLLVNYFGLYCFFLLLLKNVLHLFKKIRKTLASRSNRPFRCIISYHLFFHLRNLRIFFLFQNKQTNKK